MQSNTLTLPGQLPGAVLVRTRQMKGVCNAVVTMRDQAVCTEQPCNQLADRQKDVQVIS